MIALVWQAEQDIRCGGCGHPMDETMTPDAEDTYTARPLRCHGCAARSAAVDAHQGSAGGLYWTVSRG